LTFKEHEMEQNLFENLKTENLFSLFKRFKKTAQTNRHMSKYGNSNINVIVIYDM